jgi:hypothetical protein
MMEPVQPSSPRASIRHARQTTRWVAILVVLLVVPAATQAAYAECNNPQAPCDPPYGGCATKDQCAYENRLCPNVFAEYVAGGSIQPKDFTLIKHGGYYELFYILRRYDVQEEEAKERCLGHARTTRLDSTWSSPPDTVLSVRPTYWDNLHVWAPHIVARQDTFWMFYTGVRRNAAGGTRQITGLARSSDLIEWTKLGAVFSCDSVPWAACDSIGAYGSDFRDPFVMEDPNQPGRWLMYYCTRDSSGQAVVGLAESDGDFSRWRDVGPLWRRDSSSWQQWVDKAESPHLFSHAGTWYLFFTTGAGQALTFTTNITPTDTAATWQTSERLARLDCYNTVDLFASEYFADTLPGGSGREYFCSTTGGAIGFAPMKWRPGAHFSIDCTAPDTVKTRPDQDPVIEATTARTGAILNWVAPGDDVDRGTAVRTKAVYSTDPITDSSFAAIAGTADTLTTEPPGAAGSLECAFVPEGRLSPCTSYYFALKTMDDADNWSALSEVVSAQTLCSGPGGRWCDEEDLMVQGGEGERRGLGNSVLDLATTSEAISDVLALGDQVVDTLGRATVRLTQGGSAAMTLDAAGLALLEHPEDLQAYVCDGQVLLGRTSPVFSVRSSTGAEVDLPAEVDKPARVGAPGSTWEVTLAERESFGQALLVEVGGGGRAAGTAGIDVQVPAGKDEWVTVERIHPRRFFDRIVVDSLDAGRVRLVFNSEYPVRRLGRIEPVKRVRLTPVGAESAVQSRAGDVTDAVAHADGRVTRLASGEQLELICHVTPPARDLRCDAFLVVVGAHGSDKERAASLSRAPAVARPTMFALHHPEPNPFATATRIRFDLPRPAWVRLEIFDLQGRRVARLADELLPAGAHSRDWQGVRDDAGRVQPGVYMCRFTADTFHAEEKLVVTL